MLIILLPFVLLITSCNGSEYVESFDWMVKTFVDNDAGYDYYLELKGEAAIEEHTARIRSKISNVKFEKEFVTTMNEWLHFFRKGHIGFYQSQRRELSEVEKDSIRSKNDGIPRIEMNETEFKVYLQNPIHAIHPIEGVWKNKDYTIGIKQSEKEANKSEAFVIEADSVYWLPGMIIAEMNQVDDRSFDVSFLMMDHVVRKSKASLQGHDATFLSMFGIWVKKFPEPTYTKYDSLYVKVLTSREPFFARLSPATNYIRIPSFLSSEKKRIDALLKKNDSLIRSTRNLIIDIRNGTGGSDGSSYGFIPYLYTNPIRHPGMRYRATELNATYYEKIGFSSMAQRMKDSTGRYFESPKDAFLIKDIVKTKYPERIAIICNTKNASADESFLFMARQSYKVKIFGRRTMGAFDFGNVNVVDSPDGKYKLWLTVTAIKEYHDYRIDDYGLQPDFFIDKNMAEVDWIDFVQNEIERK